MRIYPFEDVFLQLPYCVRFSNKDVKTIKEQKHLKSLTCFAVFTQFRCINFASALCLNRDVFLQLPYCVRFSNKDVKTIKEQKVYCFSRLIVSAFQLIKEQSAIHKKAFFHRSTYLLKHKKLKFILNRSFTVYPWIYAMMSLMIWWLLWLLFGQGFTMKMGWNEELEFCEEEWKKFVADKIEIDSKCFTRRQNRTQQTRTRCCVEEKKYLLERFKMFSEICPLEGTCGCSPIILNFTVLSHDDYGHYPPLIKALFEKWKEPDYFTCSHKYIIEIIERSYSTRYTSFGKYENPYKYVLYGGKSHTCYVLMNMNLKRPDTNGFFIKHVQSGKLSNM
ncbi:uncharacterized protein LOC124451845 isoform X2 [Xenia sp. Carnegie-2017]|uniref:uncharacterized protein LOC124451845 isoform X2 n=1 Tax=Xenia sp. Carnegie-2017 TaxID=2897299 RepID=UPI001F049A96|nr:uncharacterized protein LOC124451845 isoform X2 [Xenia sp. Carnegie-2017]